MTTTNYEEVVPTDTISSYVTKFWKFDNIAGEDEQFLILPDGNFELIIKIYNNKVASIEIFGLTTKVLNILSPKETLIVGISFKPLASEYILKQYLNDILNSKKSIKNNFWEINSTPFTTFENWISQISNKISDEIKNSKNLDVRKQKTFDLLFETNGALSVQSLSEQVFWTSRQLNRYFKSRFGLSLKAYCNVLRSHAIFKQIIEGDLSPNDAFYDQSHFIREIKKHTGLNPSELNKNDRFVQFNL